MEYEKEAEQSERAGRVKLIESAAAKSDEYGSTMEALRQAGESLPVFTGSYDAQINDLFNQIINRRSFSYDPQYDPQYQSYRQRYEREGRYAMKDSIAQAASLTGGYGSSYAETVGQQQYGAYREKLGNVLPELYSAAYERYKAGADALTDQLQTAGTLADKEYGRYRDMLSDAEAEDKRADESYKNLYELMLKTGYKPTDEEMKRNGMSAGQAEAIRREYYRSKGLPFPDDVKPVSYAGSGMSDYNYYINYDFSKLGAAAATGGNLEGQKLAANASGASDTQKSRRN